MASKISLTEGRQHNLIRKLCHYIQENIFYIINQYFHWHILIHDTSQVFDNQLAFRSKVGKISWSQVGVFRSMSCGCLLLHVTVLLTACCAVSSRWHLDEVPPMAASHLGPLTPEPVLPHLSSPQLLSAITTCKYYISEKLENIKVRTT